ncbi:hypothetical protein Kisp01_27280 [Kineosporia sp. NBRC 101677]|nr:hypothetical protein Kisp01_27280 [Kineosporia sp. NBRC 101677]
MSRREQFVRAAVERGHSPSEAESFTRFLRFAIGTNGRVNGPVVGRNGGLPSLPVGLEWPRSEYGPLPFVVSYDCAALPQVEGLPIPPTGTMLFFLHHEDDYESDAKDQQHAQAIYVPLGAETVEAAEPEHAESMFSDWERNFVRPQRELYAWVRADLPEWLSRDEADLSAFQRELVQDLPHRQDLCALAQELWPAGEDCDCQLGGYSMHISELSTPHLYETPEVAMAREKVEVSTGESAKDHLLEQETHRVMGEWLPLAQFQIDEVYIGRFLIRPDDLAVGRLEGVITCTEFTE